MYFLKPSSAYLGCELQYEHKETAPSTERTSEEQLGHWIVCYTTSPLPRPFITYLRICACTQTHKCKQPGGKCGRIASCDGVRFQNLDPEIS